MRSVIQIIHITVDKIIRSKYTYLLYIIIYKLYTTRLYALLFTINDKLNCL